MRISSTRNTEEDEALYNEYEEADNRILLHITQSVRNCSFTHVIVVTLYTDVFVSLVHHFNHWMSFGLKKLLMVSGRGASKRVIHIDSLIDTLPAHLPDILPAVHALTGCDSTSNVATKLTTHSFITLFTINASLIT